MRSLRRWSQVWAIALFIAVVLSACGGNSGNDSGNGKTNGDNGGTASAGNGTNDGTGNGGTGNGGSDPAKSDVKLTMWHWKVAFDPGFKAVADAFKAKTGITVETQAFTPDDAYRQKLTGAASAGDMPDLYAYWAGPLEGAYDGKAMEMGPELDKDPTWKAGFLPSALQGVTVSQANLDTWATDEKASDWKKQRQVGQIYGVPLDVGAFYTIYGNAKLLKQAGLEAKAPATIEEWVDTMNKVKDATKTPGLVFSAKTFTLYENWFMNFVDYMKNGEESFTNFMNHDEKLSDPKHMQAIQFIEDLAKSGNILPGSVSLDIDPADQAFAQGKATYDIGGTFTYASLVAMGMKPEDIISFRVPAYAGSKVPDAKVTPFPLVQMEVTQGGPHQKEALEFVKFLTSEEGQILYANGAFDLPAVKISDTGKLSGSLQAMTNSLSSESNWWSENAAISGKVGQPEWQTFHADMQKVILGDMTAQAAAADFDKAAAAEKAKAQK